MKPSDFQGIYGIAPTPLTKAGVVDEDGLAHLVDFGAKSGLHAVVVLGSNGEWPYLDVNEKRRVIEVAARAAGGRVALVAGVSAFSTAESVALARHAREHGYHAGLAALGAYFRVSAAEAVEHFRVLARDGGLPVLYYHFPEVTGVDLAPDTISELSGLPGVVGTKVTTISRSLLKRVVKVTRTHLWSVFIGTTFLLRYAMKNGAAGALCPVPMIAPKLCLDLYQAMEKGDLKTADRLQDQVLGAIPIMTGINVGPGVSIPLFKALTRKPYTGPGDRTVSTVAMVKEALRLQGHPITAVTRHPCSSLTREQADLVKKTMEAQGWI